MERDLAKGVGEHPPLRRVAPDILDLLDELLEEPGLICSGLFGSLSLDFNVF